MKKIIHYVLILDRSGSMHDIKPAVIKSFNEQVDMIRNLQKKQPEAKIRVSLCSFNDTVKIHYMGKKAEELDKLTTDDYQPDSMTALYDAIGYTFHRVTKNVRSHHKVFFAVFTDGLENSSTEYTAEKISGIIELCGMNGWEFRFFCRYEERLLYKTRLNLSDKSLIPMYINKDGFQEMNDQVMCCMESMIEDSKDEQKSKPRPKNK